MKLPRIFLLTLLCLALTADPVFSIYQECDKIEAHATVQNASPGQSDGSVRIELVKGSRINLRFIFCAYANGAVLNEEQYHQNSVSGLSPGEYFCVVSNNDCSRKINFTVK